MLAIVRRMLPSFRSGRSLANLVRNGNGLSIVRSPTLSSGLVRRCLTEQPLALDSGWSAGLLVVCSFSTYQCEGSGSWGDRWC